MALTPGKAKKMLRDGTVHGQSLSDKQKKYFGAIAGGATPMKAINGGWLDKFAMGGSLPGASGMMYARTSGNSSMGPGKLKKAQNGDKEDIDKYTVVPEGGIELDEVVITGKSKKKKQFDESLKDMPAWMKVNDYGNYTLTGKQKQDLEDKGITDLDSYNEYYGTSFSRDNAGNEFNYLNYYKPQHDDMISGIHDATSQAARNIFTAAQFIPIFRGAGLLSKTPQAYRAIAGPLGQAYRYAANTPVGKAAFKYIGKPFGNFTRYKPGGGPFSVGNYADAASVGYGSYNIGPDVKELYNNPSWSNAGSVGLDALSYTPLLNSRFTGAITSSLPSKNTFKNIFKYYKEPLGDAFKIGNSPSSIPSFLTRGQNPPNPLVGNSKIDADRFMRAYTNPKNPEFVRRFDNQIMNEFSGSASNQNYLRSATNQMNRLKRELRVLDNNPGTAVLPKASSLRHSITELENSINGFWKAEYPALARQNMKAIQTGEFPTVFSNTGYAPGSGGTYYIPQADQPLNTWKYANNNVGNNSVVKLAEVPIGSTPAATNNARTREMLTGIHETLGHASNAGGTALTKQTNELIRGALKPNPKIKEGTAKWLTDFMGPEATFKDWSKYLEEPTEVIARIMELRRQYIPPQFWGTGKQYDISDKLVRQIFRDGLSGKSKVAPDFFRIMDEKGLKKLMKGLYATVPMAIGADGLLEYKHGGNVPKAQDGGWLSKYENGGVIEDDRGQWAHPGKVTKINSNNITMKGVDYPVLGISDTGDKKMMQPGKDYKFGGNSVTEYPMAQDGLTTKTPTPSFPYTNRVPDTLPQVEFLKNWTNSTRGQELLNNSSGDKNYKDKLTYKRINNLDNVDFSMDDNADQFLGRYNSKRHDIKLNSSLLDTSEPKLIGNQDKDVILHELSHAQDFSPGAEFNSVTIPLKDRKLINKYRKRTIKDTKKLDVSRKVKRDIKDRVNYIGDPTETRARLNSIRYFYETSPIGKEEGMPSIFDSEVSSEMMEVMKDNQQFKELQEVYDDGEILELLNTVSDNSKSSGPSNMAYAQEGNNIPLKTVNEFGELERLTYPSSVFKDEEGNPSQTVMLDPVVINAKGPIALAKEQMKKYGITNNLKQGYVKDKSENAYNNIVPQGYGNIKTNLDRYRRFKGNLGRDPEALWYDGPEDDKTHYTIPNRDDAFRLYLGMPQINNSFSVSDYRPSDSEDKSMVYLKPTYFQNPEIRQELLDDYFRKYNSGIDEKYGLGFQDKRGIGNERQLSRGEWQGDGTPFPSADNALGDFTFDMGEDDKGSYISIYDIWDLQPFSSTGEGSSLNRAGKALLNLFNKKSGKKATSESETSELFGAGKPFEVYERIYFDPKTKKIIDMKQGGSLEKKAQLTNFTKYNTPQPEGWLDKY